MVSRADFAALEYFLLDGEEPPRRLSRWCVIGGLSLLLITSLVSMSAFVVVHFHVCQKDFPLETDLQHRS